MVEVGSSGHGSYQRGGGPWKGDSVCSLCSPIAVIPAKENQGVRSCTHGCSFLEQALALLTWDKALVSL